MAGSTLESIDSLFTDKDLSEGRKPWYSAAQWSVAYRADDVMSAVSRKRERTAGLEGV